MTVELARKHRVNVGGRVESGPLVADDTGVAVKAGRKWFARSRPGTYYIFRWPDVTSWSIGAPAPRIVGGSTINSHHSQVEFRTATNVYSWELPFDRTAVTARIGRYLAGLPNG